MFLLDTNIISELRKASNQKANQGVLDWAAGTLPSQLFLSIITIAELETGILQIERRDAKQGKMLRFWLNHHVIPTFSGRILAIDIEIAQQYAKLHIPDPKPSHDALIAATALVHNLTVVTRNQADFVNTGVRIINPWQAA